MHRTFVFLPIYNKVVLKVNVIRCGRLVGLVLIKIHLGFFFRQGNVRSIFRIEVNSNEATDCIHQAEIGFSTF